VHGGVKVSGSLAVFDASDGCGLDKSVDGEQGCLGDSGYQSYPQKLLGRVAETA
jgi:hypothetical protein